jgi:hypothetical protein
MSISLQVTLAAETHLADGLTFKLLLTTILLLLLVVVVVDLTAAY